MPKTRTTRAKDPLVVVHTDICGFMPEPAMGTKALYFISFIDDYSRYATVFLIRTKDEALDAFRKYKAWAENYTGFTIKNLHSDGGGEYMSGQFTTYLHIVGIHRQVTVARTPQQNGVAERFNRTIMESARSMLHAAGLPPMYWGDAVMTAVYLRNRLPTRALNDVTPYEAWRGEKPDLSHLRVWGCQAFIHVPRVKRNKLAAKARACVFVGYPPEAKGWLLYDPTGERYVVARDVTFQESVSGTKAFVGGGASTPPSSTTSSASAESSTSPPVVPVSVRVSELPSSIASNVHEGVEFDDGSDEDSDTDSEGLPPSGAELPPLISPSSDLQSGGKALRSSQPSPSSDLLSGGKALRSSQPSLSGSPQSSGEAPRSVPVPFVSQPSDRPAVTAPAATVPEARGSVSSASNLDEHSVPAGEQAALRHQPEFGAAGERSSVSAPSVMSSSSTGSQPEAKTKKPKGQRELDRLRDSAPSNPGYVAASPLQPKPRQSRQSNQGGHRALAASVSDERSQVVNTESTVIEPRTYAEAMRTADWEQWEQAMREELASIAANNTWTLVPLPTDRKAIGCKWVLKIKRKADGSIDRFKARLVAKGFSQKEGLDFKETFAPVARMPSLRALLAIAAAQDLEIHQMDVRTAFLNGELEEEIYMQQPEGFVAPGSQANLVCKLNRSIYGLKQASRAWYKKIDSALSDLSFKPTMADNCIYVLQEHSTVVYILLYVDDLLLISNNLRRLQSVKEELSQRFDMKDLGEAHFILGLQIQRDRTHRRLSLSQSEYVKTILERFNMNESKPASTPMSTSTKLVRSNLSTSSSNEPAASVGLEDMREVPYSQAVGALMYAAMGTRPDIAYSTTILSQFLQNPARSHWVALKRVLRYLKGTQHAQLVYQQTADTSADQPLTIQGYSDSDWGNDANDRRSVTGWIFLLYGCAVSWQSRKQRTTALSSVEAEYMAAASAAKEAVWWRRFLTELGLPPSGPTVIHSDSQGSIALANNPDHHDRTKHIDLRYHYLREQVALRAIRPEFVGTELMLADVLTKPLSRDRHQALVTKVGLTA